MLKTKMFISFSIVSLFIVGITCIIFYFKNTGDVKNQTFFLSNIIAKQFSRMIDLYMQNIEELSLAISIDPAIQTNLFNFYNATTPIEKETPGYKLNPVLFSFSYPKSYVQSISIYTSDGLLYTYSKLVKADPDISFSKKELTDFTDVLSDRPFLLIPSFEKRTIEGQPEKIVSFVRKITKIPTQTIIGFVNIHINVSAFKLVLENVNTNEMETTMHALIVNDEGQVIFENGGNMTGNAQSFFDPAVFKKQISEGEVNWNDKQYMYTFERSNYTGWNTVILIPKDVILVKQKRIQDIVFIVGLITMLLIAAVSYYLSYQITLPLNNMMRKMHRVELGDLQARMEYTGKNEFGRLSRTYNYMLDSISRLINEVYESKLAEKNAQLSALHAQINPHFLYNTLNTMKSISRLRGIEEVAEISESLAGLFQFSMKNLHQPVSLAEEVDHINNYFKILQHRFGSRLELQCDIPMELLQASILKLSIQPLIENAVNHGLRRMKTGGCIKIRAVKGDGILTITVMDNGEGMNEEKWLRLNIALESSQTIHPSNDSGHGIGLYNIHQRVQLYYGKEYGLQLFSKPGQGTTVKLTIPYISA